MRTCSPRIGTSSVLLTWTSRVGEPTQSTHGYVMTFHIFCGMPRSVPIERRPDVHACQILCWGGPHYHASTWEFCPPAIPSVLVAGAGSFFRQLLTACNFFQLSVSFFCKTKKNARCVPLRHHWCQRDGAITSDSFLWFRIRFS